MKPDSLLKMCGVSPKGPTGEDVLPRHHSPRNNSPVGNFGSQIPDLVQESSSPSQNSSTTTTPRPSLGPSARSISDKGKGTIVDDSSRARSLTSSNDKAAKGNRIEGSWEIKVPVPKDLLQGLQVPKLTLVFESEPEMRAELMEKMDCEIALPGSIILQKEPAPSDLFGYISIAMQLKVNCTIQLGSVGLLRKTDDEISYWKVQKHWTPEILSVHRHPRKLWQFLTGEAPEWCVIGLNLQQTTLTAVTTELKETVTVIHQSEIAQKTMIVFKEPELCSISRAKVYMYASNYVEVEGMTLKVYSEAKEVRQAYWTSVIDGWFPSPWSVIKMTVLSLMGGSIHTWVAHTREGLETSLVAYCITGLLFLVSTYFYFTHRTIFSRGTSTTTLAGPCQPSLPLGFTEEEDKLNDSVSQLYLPLGMHDEIGAMPSMRDHGTSAAISAGPREPNLPTGLTEEEDKRNYPVSQFSVPLGEIGAMPSMRDYGTSASTSAGPRKPILPPGLTEEEDKLNESVWQLYAPSGRHDMEIIFFHGLQMGDFEEAFWKTWRSLNDQVVWPREWLPKKFRNARILSVTYDASARHNEGQVDEYLLGGNLVSDIIQDREWNIGQNCPVFLVGHCLGGIVIKQFILSALRKKSSMPVKDREIKKFTTFLDNLKGAFFYGTPHSGGDGISSFIKSQFSSASKLAKNPILNLLRTLDNQTGRINDDFSKHRRNLEIRTYNIWEGRPTVAPGFEDLLVPEASARQDTDDFYVHTPADHFTICKANGMREAPIGKLTQFIAEALADQTTVTQSDTVTDAMIL